MAKRYWFLIVACILFSIGLVIFGIRTSPKEHNYDEQLMKIESKLDSLYLKKDSVRTIIITVDKKIIENKKEHEKVVNSIIIQPSATDSIFARDYIKKFIDERIR